jgi:hypothetical protein
MIGDPEPLLQMIVDDDLRADFDIGANGGYFCAGARSTRISTPDWRMPVS